jgi:hypothetical protein
MDNNTTIILAAILACTAIYIVYTMNQKGCSKQSFHSLNDNPPEYPCEHCLVGVQNKFYEPVRQYCSNIDPNGNTCGGQKLLTDAYTRALMAESRLTCSQICK